MNTLSLESFISSCDDMMIAEEGFKDILTNIKTAISKIWTAFMKKVKYFIRFIIGSKKQKTDNSAADINKELPQTIDKIMEREFDIINALNDRVNLIINEICLASSSSHSTVRNFSKYSSIFDIDQPCELTEIELLRLLNTVEQIVTGIKKEKKQSIIKYWSENVQNLKISFDKLDSAYYKYQKILNLSDRSKLDAMDGFTNIVQIMFEDFNRVIKLYMKVIDFSMID